MTDMTRPVSFAPALLGIAFCALLIGFAATEAWNIYATYCDHVRACALPAHSTNCGD